MSHDVELRGEGSKMQTEREEVEEKLNWFIKTATKGASEPEIQTKQKPDEREPKDEQE